MAPSGGDAATGDVVPAKKPAPDVYHYVLKEVRLDPNQCLAFEDSELGLRSSLAAGLKTIVTVNPYTARQDLSGAALVTDNLGEPAQPIDILAGNGYGSTYVDFDLLCKLFGDK
jgi:beta-phosphoglucomutase-like phosphatase (HAD superfamily)